MSGVGTGIALAAGIGGASSIGGALIGSSAAGNAANAQVSAEERAAQLQFQEANNSLDFQKQEWNTQQKNLAPWLQGGKMGLSQLETLLGLGGNSSAPGYGSLLTPFTAPTEAEAANEPGYKFGLDQSEEALQNSAAAKGNVFSGNTQEALGKFANDYAENNYTNVYNRAFNTFETNQSNTFNRLAALSGIGQTAATTLGTEGSQVSNTVAGIDANLGSELGQDYSNIGNAEASGYVGSANAWTGGLGGGSNSLMQLMLMQQLYGGGGSNPYGPLPGGGFPSGMDG